MSNKRKLIIVGQTPPPYNGQAKMIRLMIDGISDEFDPVHIRMAYSDSIVSAGKFRFSKIRHLIQLIQETRRALKKYPNAVLYYPPASPNLIPILRDMIYLLAVRPLAGETVFHFHSGGVSGFVRNRKLLCALAMKAYGNADVAIELGQSCPKDGEFFHARQVYVVPNGVDVCVSKGGEGVSDIDRLKILYVGIHTETKGLFDLLETAKELKSRGVRFNVRTAGLWYTEEERSSFQTLQAEWGLTEEVQTCGQQTGEALWALYQWADVFLFPTFYAWETFGIVQLEAMAYGLPVVASNWQGPRDVVVHEKTGFLCAPHDVNSFASALQQLADDRTLCIQMGRAGEKRYRENYTAECFIANMKQIFEEVCS